VSATPPAHRPGPLAALGRVALPARVVVALGWSMLSLAMALPMVAWSLGWLHRVEVTLPVAVVLHEPAPVEQEESPAVVACPKGQVGDPPTGGRADDPASEADDPVALRETSSPMRFIKLTGGEFTMGSLAGVGDDDEHPAHRVCVAAFELAVHELTNAQWRAVTTAKPPSDCDFGCNDNTPVQNLSWDDATRFLDALSVREGRQPCYESGGTLEPACEGYRLPTEAEWEYAARGGATTEYSFGDAAAEKYAWYQENSGSKVHPVVTRAGNPFGLYDIHGNVWEWVQDWHGLYGGEGGDAGGPAARGRVLRGGSFADEPEALRSANRIRSRPSYSSGLIGLRVARGAPPQSLAR
jgi:formylglycine-generating enzyme required for sulfatase activity